MPFYAHTLDGESQEHWEQLFTPFGDGEEECQRENCQKCELMKRDHGHLNKVAWWTAKFASDTPPFSPPINPFAPLIHRFAPITHAIAPLPCDNRIANTYSSPAPSPSTPLIIKTLAMIKSTPPPFPAVAHSPSPYGPSSGKSAGSPRRSTASSSASAKSKPTFPDFPKLNIP